MQSARRWGAAVFVIALVFSTSPSRAVFAQTPLPLPAAYGEAAPPSSIAGLVDARPISPLEFSRAWLLKVENVRRRRAELTASGKLDGMTPAAAALSGAALHGTLRVPVLPVRYSDVREPFPVSELAHRLFGEPRGDTMTYSGYWREVSNGLLNVSGAITPWISLSKDAKHYLPREKYGWGQFGRMGDLRMEALRAADRTLDFAQFDNDGADGVPNSDDDDGFVDFVAFIYALPCPGEARAGAIWPHRAAMPPFETRDVSKRGRKILIADYVILPAVDPKTCGPMHVGVLAHETGHALGLPDLYDYDGSSQGIGSWGLMGTGSHSAAHSPAHPSAWEKEQLGWVAVKWLTQSGVVNFEPVERSATVYRYDLPHRSGEYLLVENRQRIGSDRFLPGHGLLTWRIDPERGELGAWNMDERRSAVSLIEADGRGDLKRGVRADPGDPFPGVTDQRFFAPTDLPTFRLARITEESHTVIADVAIGYDAPALVPAADAVRLTAFIGDSTVSQSVRVHVDGEVGEWSAVSHADWLRATSNGTGVELVADTRPLPPGRYTEVIDLIAGSGAVAGRLVVELNVALPGLPEQMAADLPWSWGLAARGSQLFQASYGWDALGLRPRPRVLHIRDGQIHPSTLARLPADALYAPVPTTDGKSLYVLARARGENFVYHLDSDGNATIAASRVGTSPAYGAALLPNGELLVAEWNGMVWRVDRTGGSHPYVKLNANLYQIATDGRGTLFAATYDGTVIRWSAETGTAVFDTGFEDGKLVAVAASKDGAVYAAERGDGGRIIRFDGNGQRQIVFQSTLARFYGLAVESEFLYALDLHDRRLLRIPVHEQPTLANSKRPGFPSAAGPERPALRINQQ